MSKCFSKGRFKGRIKEGDPIQTNSLLVNQLLAIKEDPFVAKRSSCLSFDFLKLSTISVFLNS